MIRAKRKQNIKFLTIYNSFSEKEKNEFKKFVKKIHNGNKRNYDKLLSSLYINENGTIELSLTESDRTRWNRLSELSVLADKFLISKSIESDSLGNNYYLFKEYRKRNLSSLLEHKYEKLKSIIYDKPDVSMDSHFINNINKIYLDHLKSTSRTKKYTKKLIESNKLSVCVYLIELHEQLIEIWNRKNANAINSVTLAEEIYSNLNFKLIFSQLSKTSKYEVKLYYILKFLHLIYLSLLNPESNYHYISAKKIFFRELKTLSLEMRELFYGYLIDKILDRKNQDIPGSTEELFFLMNKKLKEGLSEDVLYKELPINKFRDYILIALDLGKCNWAIKFINDYGPLLPPDIRSEYVLTGKAFVSMYKKQFSKSLDFINEIKMKNPVNHAATSILKLKAYYELKQFDKCYEELKIVNDYLRKKRAIHRQFIIYAKGFCKAYFRLLKLNQNPTINNLSLLEFFLSKEVFIGKKWVIQKMNEIKLLT